MTCDSAYACYLALEKSATAFPLLAGVVASAIFLLLFSGLKSGWDRLNPRSPSRNERTLRRIHSTLEPLKRRDATRYLIFSSSLFLAGSIGAFALMTGGRTSDSWFGQGTLFANTIAAIFLFLFIEGYAFKARILMMRDPLEAPRIFLRQLKKTPITAEAFDKLLEKQRLFEVEMERDGVRPPFTGS